MLKKTFVNVAIKKTEVEPPASKIYSLTKVPTIPVLDKHKNKPSVVSQQVTTQKKNTDTIIQLKLTKKEIKLIEQKLSCQSTMPLLNEYKGDPTAYNTIDCEVSIIAQKQEDKLENMQNMKEADNNPFSGILKMKDKNVVMVTNKDSEQPTPSRKDLIINSGVHKRIHQSLTVYSEGWPSHSPYACWLDCHTFNNTPVGIPERCVNGVFYLSGNFCSYNCALRYLVGDYEGDMDMFGSLQTLQDIAVNDDRANKIQLLKLLCERETGLDIFSDIKPSGPRLALMLFGGDQSIEKFRSNFMQHTEYHVFRSPLVPIAYHLEETIDIIKRTKTKQPKVASLDTIRVEKTYNALIEQKKRNNKCVLDKILKV